MNARKLFLVVLCALLILTLLHLPALAAITPLDMPPMHVYDWDANVTWGNEAGYALWTISGGYLFGGRFFDKYGEGINGPMVQGDALVRLNENLTERWRVADDRLAGLMVCRVKETEDHRLLLQGAFHDLANEDVPGRGTLISISQDGVLEWIYYNDSEKYICDFWPMEDGGCLWVGQNSSWTKNFGETALYGRVDGSGQSLWMRERPFNQNYLRSLDAICPLENGYVLAGMGLKTFVALWVDADGDVLGETSIEMPCPNTVLLSDIFYLSGDGIWMLGYSIGEATRWEEINWCAPLTPADFR